MNSEQRLIEAIEDCRIYQTRILLALGTKAEFVDNFGFSPLLRACRIEDDKRRTRTVLIKLLIEYGANVNTKDPQGHHALAYACITSKEDIVNLLLDTSLQDIDLNQQDTDGNTPLFHAIRSGNITILKLLISSMNKFHINMHFRNNADRTPYLEAVLLGRTECARILLEEGNASSEAKVNPFLVNSLKEKAYERELLWKIEGDQQRLNVSVCHSTASNSSTKLYQRKSLLKRNADPRKCSETIERTFIEPKENDNIKNAVSSVDPIRIPKVDSCLATPVNQSQNTHCANKFEVDKRRSDIHCTTSVFLTDNTAHFRGFMPRHRRAKTAPLKSLKSRRASGAATDDESAIWHSHFTCNKKPSMNCLNILMTLYGEQCSPESSYRKSVKPRIISKTDDQGTTVGLEHELEKPSDGRRSSSGSVRSLSGAGRTKFSALLNRVAASSIPNKRSNKSRI